jgi:hypothetical protein
VYQGEKIAEVNSPAASDRIVVGQTLQIAGSAYVDDFASYTLDFGAGDNPTAWTPITDARKQAVDKALLGVWNTTGLQPGRYRMRLRVVDEFQNAQESQPLIVTLSAPATPTPTPIPTPTVVAVTPTRATTQPPAAPGSPTATPQGPRGATPTAVQRTTPIPRP